MARTAEDIIRQKLGDQEVQIIVLTAEAERLRELLAEAIAKQTEAEAKD